MVPAVNRGDAPHKPDTNGVRNFKTGSTPMPSHHTDDDNVKSTDDLNDGNGWMLLKALYR